MKLQIEWGRPIQLRDASKDNMIYGLDLSKVNVAAGIYIFGRRWGRQFEALYVGKANNIRSRVKGHLNNLRLMQHLHNARTGKRVLLAGKLVTKRGQRLSKVFGADGAGSHSVLPVGRARLGQQARYPASPASTRVARSASEAILSESDLLGKSQGRIADRSCFVA